MAEVPSLEVVLENATNCFNEVASGASTVTVDQVKVIGKNMQEKAGRTPTEEDIKQAQDFYASLADDATFTLD